MLCGKDVLAHKDVDDESAQVDQGLKIKPVTVGACTPNFLNKR